MDKREDALTPLTPHPDIKKDRLTLRISIVHEHRGDKPQGFEQSYWKMLKTEGDDGQTCQRRRPAVEEWKPLYLDQHRETGTAGLIVVWNLAGLDLVVNPTDKEKAAIAKQIVHVASLDEQGQPLGMVLVIPPGEFQTITVADPLKLGIRSLSGQTSYRVTIFPR